MSRKAGSSRQQQVYCCSENNCDFIIKKQFAKYVEHLKVVHGIEL